MNKRADLIVYDRDKNLQLVVEVKGKSGASREWATRMRRNLLAHSVVPNAPYFLLVLPDAFYLWIDGNSIPSEVPPQYEVDARETLGSVVAPGRLSLDQISEYSLELLVASWLQDLMNSDLSRETAGPGLEWLFDSGLYQAIKNGSIATQALV